MDIGETIWVHSGVLSLPAQAITAIQVMFLSALPPDSKHKNILTNELNEGLIRYYLQSKKNHATAGKTADSHMAGNCEENPGRYEIFAGKFTLGNHRKMERRKIFFGIIRDNSMRRLVAVHGPFINTLSAGALKMVKIAALAIIGTFMFLSIGGTAHAQATKRNIAQEEANRALVLKFYDTFFNLHKVDEAATVVAEDYIQHNPEVPNGKEPFVSYFREFFKQTPGSRARIVRSAVDGDIVWLHVHSVNNEKERGEAVIDIFRVENGKIVEHWDVVQAVPETAENDNTMF